MKKFMVITAVCVLAINSFADIWWVDDYLAINDGDIYDGEIFGINNGIIDIFGGDVGKIELRDISKANVYDGIIFWFDVKLNATLNLYGGTIGDGALGVYDNANVNLFAYDVVFYPEVEAGESWVEGYYIQNDEFFQIPVWDSSHLDKINVIPEPTSFLLLFSGSILLKNRN